MKAEIKSKQSNYVVVKFNTPRGFHEKYSKTAQLEFERDCFEELFNDCFLGNDISLSKTQIDIRYSDYGGHELIFTIEGDVYALVKAIKEG